MSEELILEATTLMQEQTEAYERLSKTCGNLAAALINSTPDVIGAIVRTGEIELLNMRSRLLRMMSALATFADARAASIETPALSPNTRQAFSQASSALQKAASEFQQAGARTSALAVNGEILSAVCMELCGIQPTTYRAPYVRQGEGKSWV